LRNWVAARRPPLTRRIWPLTQDVPGLTRYATAMRERLTGRLSAKERGALLRVAGRLGEGT
jgi:hypothetical protein